MSEEKKEISLRGERIFYTDKEEEGADYLDNHLDGDCFDVILYYAKDKSSGAPFMDRYGNKYLLRRSGDHYELSRK